MSTSIKTCPGCSSLILSDTSECPECGTVFNEELAEANAIARASIEMKTQNMYDNCKKCGSSVRSGLVRCWSCNAFMRKDVEARYTEMMTSPQKIIYSEQADRDKDEVIPARITSKGEEVYDGVGDDDGFQLGSGVSSRQNESDASGDEFELDVVKEAIAEQPPATSQPATSQPAASPPATSQSATQSPAPTPAQAEPKPTPDQQPPAGDPTSASPPAEATDQSPAAKTTASTDNSDDKNVDDDEFVGLALSEAKETHQRKRRKVEQSRRRRVLVPCTTCGAWIRVFQDQAGRTVRCQKCKTPFVVPQIKKKDKTSDTPSKSSGVSLDWIEDVRLHVVSPTEIVLKPGSLNKGSETADVTFHDGQMYVVKFATSAKKSLFGKGKGEAEIPAQRSQVRDAISRSGNLNSVPVGECLPLAAAQASNVKLAQPVAAAHASMFAGVPVFGPGKIAIYLPIAQPDNQQIFLSMTLSQGRLMAERLQQTLGVDLQLADNGVPATDQKEMLKCKLVEIPVEAVRSVEYYENDPAFELEMTGYRCGTCQMVISEDGRARKKLGGATGRGIAKAKCPGCSAKMGKHPTYRISKSPYDSADEE